jgi:flagellar operon protein
MAINDIQKNILMSQLTRVDRTSPVAQPSKSRNVSGGASSEISFEKELDQATGLQFSKHAEKRLLSRNLELNQVERAKLQDAVSSLEKKGAKDSLVLMGELAFVVNVPSKTVVTALSKEQMKDQIFTNIDSTILV